MGKTKRSFMNKLQKLGRTLMTPMAVLPVAAILFRFGQVDIWIPMGILPNGIPWMVAAAEAIFSNLALIFAISIAIGLADENNGVAAISAVMGFFILTKVALAINSTIEMGILEGILIGSLSAYLYNKYKLIKVPELLGFFGGKRFVPIITSIYSLLIGLFIGYVWPLIESSISILGNNVNKFGVVGVFIFGFFNRILIPFGLDNKFNSSFWFEFGTYTNRVGNVVTGDINRFLAGDPLAGTFMTGLFPITMFALPAACIAIITAANKENKKSVTGMLVGFALISFLTGITIPIEFMFMFLAPVLYLIHAILTGAALVITYLLGMKCGFVFSAGLIDYLLNFRISTKPLGILGVGLIFGIAYYFIFLYFIKKFDIPTPGRMEEESIKLCNLKDSELKQKAEEMIEAIGEKENIVSIEACITRIRLEVVDSTKVDEALLKEIGATAVMKLNSTNYQIIVGNIADSLVTYIDNLME